MVGIDRHSVAIGRNQKKNKSHRGPFDKFRADTENTENLNFFQTRINTD
jgi:hypothetical protein